MKFHSLACGPAHLQFKVLMKFWYCTVLFILFWVVGSSFFPDDENCTDSFFSLPIQTRQGLMVPSQQSAKVCLMDFNSLFDALVIQMPFILLVCSSDKRTSTPPLVSTSARCCWQHLSRCRAPGCLELCSLGLAEWLRWLCAFASCSRPAGCLVRRGDLRSKTSRCDGSRPLLAT